MTWSLLGILLFSGVTKEEKLNGSSYIEDWENAELHAKSHPYNTSGHFTPDISSNQAHSGSYSVRSYVPNAADGGDYRSEIRHKGGWGEPTPIDWKHPYNTVRTFSAWIYLPEGHLSPANEASVFQWKNFKDPGCDVGFPAFSIREKNGQWEYNLKHDGDTACTTSVETLSGIIDNSLTTGQWHHFQIEIFYNYTAAGYLKLYYAEGDTVDVDTNLVFDYQGPTGYNDQQGPYAKWGYYISAWKNKSRRAADSKVKGLEMYLDDVGILEGSISK